MQGVRLQIPVSSLVSKVVYWTSCPNRSCNMKGKEGIMQSLDCEICPEQRWGDPRTLFPPFIAALWPVLRALIPLPTQHGYRRSPIQVRCPRNLLAAHGGLCNYVQVLTPAEGPDSSRGMHGKLMAISRPPLPTWAKGTTVCFHENWAGGAEGVSNEGPPASC